MGTLPYRLVMAALVLLTTGCAARVQADLQPWQLRGTVVSVQNSTLEVRHKTGRIIRLTVDAQTIYVGKDGRLSSQSLAPGRRVRVEVDQGTTVQRARRVQIFGASQ